VERDREAASPSVRGRPQYDPRVGGDLFGELAARLREAHALVRGLDLPAEEKAAVTTRLIAITDASKHDLDRASARLDALLADLGSRCDTGPPVFEGNETAP
jgi:hypothetical protein